MRALTSTEHFTASVTSGRKLGVVAVAAVNLIRFRAELFVDERDATHIAQEACFMPVFVFVAQVLYRLHKYKSINEAFHQTSAALNSPWNQFQ